MIGEQRKALSLLESTHDLLSECAHRRKTDMAKLILKLVQREAKRLGIAT